MNNIIKSGFSPENEVSFLSKILPKTGVYVLAEFRNGLKSAPLHHFFNNVEELEASALKYDATGVNVFHACASYKTDANRKQENAGWMRSIWLDVDCMKENDAKSYATRKEALAATLGMCETLGLPAPMIIKSGMGIHVYWVLDRDLTKDEWQTIVNAFSNALNSVNFKHDPSRTKDAASVLRPVGTHWRKGDGVKAVELIHDAPEYSVDIFNAIVGQYSEARSAELIPSNVVSLFQMTNDLGAGIEYPPSSAKEIIKHCAALNEVAETKGNVAEPLWRAMIGVVKHTTEGEAKCHEWSQGDSRYSQSETQAKIDGWVNGPTTCQHFSDLSDKCKSCEHAGKITSPISLGTMTAEPKLVDSENTRTLFDIRSYSATRFLNGNPPKVRWIFPNFLPVLGETVALMTAPGAVGKTQMFLQMAISRATGAKFLGKFSVEETGPVIMFTAENSEESLHRRIAKIISGLKIRGEWPINGDALLQNLYVFPTLGINMRLLHFDRFNRGYSSMVNQLISSISEIEGCPLIFIDPISRFMGGDENDADTATRFMEALEFIAKKTNCCALIAAHHVNKTSGRSDELDQFGSRGSSAFSDASRWQLSLGYLPLKEKEKLPESMRRDFIRAEVTKMTDGAIPDPIRLRRTEGGFLIAVDDFIQSAETAQSELDLKNVVHQLSKVEHLEPIAKRTFADKYASNLGLSKDRVEKLLMSGIERKLISQSGTIGKNRPLKVSEVGNEFIARRYN
jgi:hypothetical protein